MNLTSHILPQKVATIIATNTKLSSNASSQKPPPKIPTIINTLRKYFTTKTTNTKSLKYPNANPQINNNNDAKYPKRSKTISKTATLIKKIKKATTKKLQKLSKKTTRQNKQLILPRLIQYLVYHHTYYDPDL